MSITCQITQHDKEMLCRKAPEFSAIVARFPEVSGFDCTGDLFYALVESIISQQLAVKAAAAIFGRVEHLLGEISPGNLLAADNLQLRQCGLSPTQNRLSPRHCGCVVIRQDQFFRPCGERGLRGYCNAHHS